MKELEPGLRPITHKEVAINNDMKSSSNHRETAETLAGLLADTYVLYNRTQLYHWNVEGPQFRALHTLFEEQYRDLALAVDMIAERIRTLGYYAPGSLQELADNTRLDQERVAHDAKDMVLHLVEGHQEVARRLEELRPVAEAAKDESTVDLAVERLRVHEKAAWMLNSQAGRSSEWLTGLSEAAKRKTA